VHALNAAGAPVSFAEIETDKGHDAFLLDVPELFAIVRGFLDSAAKKRGVKAEEIMLTSTNPGAFVARGPKTPRLDHRRGREHGRARLARARRRLRRRRTPAIASETATSTAAASKFRATASTNASPRVSP
jgi:hypothetical protein